jgi:predicted ABC-type ATPase
VATRPSVVVLAGPNGAGKSTAASWLLRGPFTVADFVNADDIALGRSPADPAHAAVAAGREMLARLHDLARQRDSFAFETTLATRHFAPWLEQLKETGYAVRPSELLRTLPAVDHGVADVR